MKEGQEEGRTTLGTQFPYRTPVGVMLDAGIASAVNGFFGAGIVVGAWPCWTCWLDMI
jgi:hypothetical protein